MIIVTIIIIKTVLTSDAIAKMLQEHFTYSVTNTPQMLVSECVGFNVPLNT